MVKSLPPLTLEILKAEASTFAFRESTHDEPTLFGMDNGKTIGTYLDQKFQTSLLERYDFPPGNAAKGIDLPGLNVDIKVTSIAQPQSSSPFRSARQKIYGLGYSLLIFVYEKHDDLAASTARLNILHTVFVEAEQTADFQTTSGILRLLENQANRDDLLALFEERMLPVDEITAGQLVDEILRKPPQLGYLTISNALQWRLQYRRVIERAGSVPGIQRLK